MKEVYYLNEKELKELVIKRIIEDVIIEYEIRYPKEDFSEDKLKSLIEEKDFVEWFFYIGDLIPLHYLTNKAEMYVNSKKVDYVKVKDVIPEIDKQFLFEIIKEEIDNTVPF